MPGIRLRIDVHMRFADVFLNRLDSLADALMHHDFFRDVRTLPDNRLLVPFDHIEFTRRRLDGCGGQTVDHRAALDHHALVTQLYGLLDGALGRVDSDVVPILALPLPDLELFLDDRNVLFAVWGSACRISVGGRPRIKCSLLVEDRLNLVLPRGVIEVD